jgi:hypothetical protein
MIKEGSTDLVQDYIETANQLGSEYITVPISFQNYVVRQLMITKTSVTHK